jgi:hypothetical protein
MIIYKDIYDPILIFLMNSDNLEKANILSFIMEIKIIIVIN